MPLHVWSESRFLRRQAGSAALGLILTKRTPVWWVHIMRRPPYGASGHGRENPVGPAGRRNLNQPPDLNAGGAGRGQHRPGPRGAPGASAPGVPKARGSGIRNRGSGRRRGSGALPGAKEVGSMTSTVPLQFIVWRHGARAGQRPVGRRGLRRGSWGSRRRSLIARARARMRAGWYEQDPVLRLAVDRLIDRLSAELRAR